jgi:hypothetical protein
MDDIGLLSLILSILPPRYSVEAKVAGNSITVKIKNVGMRSVQITDLCLTDSSQKAFICIEGGGPGKLNWDNNFEFPKTLSRDEQCTCVLYWAESIFQPFQNELRLRVTVWSSRDQRIHSSWLKLIK